MMTQYALGFGQWLQALAYTLAKPREIAIVGDPESADTKALLRIVRDGYRPFQAVALGEPGIDDVQLARLRQLPSSTDDKVVRIAAVPLLQDRGLIDGRAAAYVCRNFACQAPVTDPEALRTEVEHS